MNPLRLALLDLSRRRVPSVIAVLSIAMAVAWCGILLRLDVLAESRFATLSAGGDAIVGAKAGGIEMMLGALDAEGPYPGFLPYNLFESIRSVQTVRFDDGTPSMPHFIDSVIPLLYFGLYRDHRVIATDASFFSRPSNDAPIGFAEGGWSDERGQVVVGSQVARQEHLAVGDAIVARAWVGEPSDETIPLRVSGILRPTASSWDRCLFGSFATAHPVLASVDLSKSSSWGPDVVNYLLVYLEPNGYRLLARLVNRRTVGQAVLVADQKERLRQLAGVGRQFGLAITGSILGLGALSMTSLLVTRFEAMASQLAVLRALGYRKRSIGRWLLWEGFLLGAAACTLGALFDGLGFPVARRLLGDALPPPELVTSSILHSAPVWGVCLLATTASVFLPLYRVYHQDVHSSLRS